MKSRTARFLMISLILVSVLYIVIFTFQTVYMKQKSAETIGEIGGIYMAGMSEQVTSHFGTIIELRLSQVEALVDSVPPDRTNVGTTVRMLLTYNARARGFDSLAFYMEDGNLDMIYGNQIEVDDAGVFFQSLKNGEEKMVMGSDAAGEKIILMGVPAAYPMEDGRKNIALVAGFPADYISQTIYAEVDESIGYSIITRDGTFVIKGSQEEDDCYFETVRKHYETVEGNPIEEYIENLKSAMAAGKEYASEVNIHGERRHLYCKSLPGSEWYLLVSMPYGTLDEAIDSFGKQWIYTALGDCAVILLIFLIVFAGYFRLTHQQMKAMDEARQEAERASKAKSEFLSNMSHDIRTPMNGIVGMTAIASANIDDVQQVQNCLKKISMSSKHLLGLINDILDMSKIESGKMVLKVERVSLRETMQNIVNIIQPQAKEKGQRFEMYIQDIITENVLCDSVRLNQVLLNILGNAVKFTPEKGNIQLVLQQEVSAKGDAFVRVHLWAEDDGIGMTPEFKEKIFESFMREDNARVQKTEGAGLGMSITKYIVDAMGGTIEVESELGKGSRFHVTLDLEKALAQEEDMSLPVRNILVVDEDEQLYRSVAAVLKGMGISACWALDQEAALQMLDGQQKKGDGFQVVLLDQKLPEMDGMQIVRKIRKCYGDEIHILIVSAYDCNEDEKEALAAGVDGFVNKPLFPSTLYDSLKQLGKAGETKTRQKESEAKDFSGRHVLLAEDIDLNWEVASMLLSGVGLELERAENGQICVEKFSKSPAGYYDMILMDIRMPVMTGYEATKAIRALERPDAGSIPIIAMSADAFSDDVQKCLDCGMNAHAAKPIDIREILQFLEKYVK